MSADEVTITADEVRFSLNPDETGRLAFCKEGRELWIVNSHDSMRHDAVYMTAKGSIPVKAVVS